MPYQIPAKQSRINLSLFFLSLSQMTFAKSTNPFITRLAKSTIFNVPAFFIFYCNHQFSIQVAAHCILLSVYITIPSVMEAQTSLNFMERYISWSLTFPMYWHCPSIKNSSILKDHLWNGNKILPRPPPKMILLRASRCTLLHHTTRGIGRNLPILKEYKIETSWWD